MRMPAVRTPARTQRWPTEALTRSLPRSSRSASTTSTAVRPTRASAERGLARDRVSEREDRIWIVKYGPGGPGNSIGCSGPVGGFPPRSNGLRAAPATRKTCSLDQASAQRFRHRRGAVGGPELLEDVLQVGLHGVGGDVELLRDVLVRVSEREQLEDLDLPRSQRLRAPVALLRLGELLGERDDELRVDHHVAAGDEPDRLDQVLRVAGLEDVAAGSGAHRLDHELPVVVGGEHDDPHLGEAAPDLPGGLQAVHLGPPDVHQADLRLGLLHELEEIPPVRGLSYDLDAVRHVEVAAETLSHERVVVGDGYLDRHP